MNKLKTGKGALKDYHRYLADEYDDYIEEPEETDPISYVDKYQMEEIIQKRKPLVIKHTSRWPRYKPDFNLEVYSQGILAGVFGEKMVKYLKISDIVRLMSTCRFFFRVFSKACIWVYHIRKQPGNLSVSDKGLLTINPQQYCKYLHYSKKTGIVYDTIIMERNAKDEDKLLARTLVDFVPIKSQRAVEMTRKLTQKGALTGDMKISWIKETNQVGVWISGFYTQRYEVYPFSCVLFNKEYEEGLIQKAYFLNDEYFVIEMGEKDDTKSLEVFAIEAEPEWYEKKQSASCKQILKETFTEKVKNIQIKNIGDFFVFILEKEEKLVRLQVFDVNGDERWRSKPGDLKMDADFYDVIVSNSGTQNSFRLYLLDKELNVYILNYSLESGMAMKKINYPIPEKDNKEVTLDNVKRYHYGTNQSKTLEYLMIYKEKKFSLLMFDCNQFIFYDLPDYDAESGFFNWTVCENYLYILLESSIQIYQFGFTRCSARLHKNQIFERPKFQGSGSRWIFVSPCMTMILSTSESSTVQMLIGSTQRLLVSKKFYPFDWAPDEFYLENMLENVEGMEWKFEDERLVIKTNVRTYFRDFNVCCGKYIDRDQYKWKSKDKHDMEIEEKEEDLKQGKTEKKIKIPNLLKHENKNHDGKMKKCGNQNWKNIEKKVETEEKIEKKETRKKGDKYYKNVRQGIHREKVSSDS